MKDICVRRETESLVGEVEDKRWASRLRWEGVGRNSVEKFPQKSTTDSSSLQMREAMVKEQAYLG